MGHFRQRLPGRRWRLGIAGLVLSAGIILIAVHILVVDSDPLDQVSGLALMAGSDQRGTSPDFSRYPPEVLLAAVDLCGALFGDQSARRLLEQWIEHVGGPQTAGELAHTLLLEARLPYGGGSTALELMKSVNDPQAILVGLYEFAVSAELPPAIRSEALILLRDHMEGEAYRKFARHCAERAQQEGGAWALRAARLQEWMDSAAAASSGPHVIDRLFVEAAFARPYPGVIEDLELYLRHEARAGRVRLDSEVAVFMGESLSNLDEAALPDHDVAALRRLRRQIDSWKPIRK